MVKDVWQARDMAIAQYEQAHPEPQKPATPEGITPQPSRVIRHEEGKLWFEAVSRSEWHAAYEPVFRIELTNNTDALQLNFDVDELELLISEFQRAVDEMKALQAVAIERTQREATFKREWDEWRQGRNLAAKEAQQKWEAAHPVDEDTDEETDEAAF